jgi:hypothetical protein
MSAFIKESFATPRYGGAIKKEDEGYQKPKVYQGPTSNGNTNNLT